MDTVDFTTEGGTTTEYTYAGTVDTASEYLEYFILPLILLRCASTTKKEHLF